MTYIGEEEPGKKYGRRHKRKKRLIDPREKKGPNGCAVILPQGEV